MPKQEPAGVRLPPKNYKPPAITPERVIIATLGKPPAEAAAVVRKLDAKAKQTLIELYTAKPRADVAAIRELVYPKPSNPKPKSNEAETQ